MAFAADYLSFPVWLPEAWNEAQRGLQSYGVFNGNVFEPVERVAYATPNKTLSIRHFAKTRADRWEVEEHFRAMRGREGLFWIPSFRDAFALAAPAVASGEALELADAQTLFALNGVKRHVWFPEAAEAYEIANPTLSGGNVLVDVSPPLATDKAAGLDAWALLLVRFAGDVLEIAAEGRLMAESADGEAHEVAAIQLSFLESQGNTPTAF